MNKLTKSAACVSLSVAVATAVGVGAATPAQAYLCGYGSGCFPPDVTPGVSSWANGVSGFTWQYVKPACGGPMYAVDLYYGSVSGDALGACEDPAVAAAQAASAPVVNPVVAAKESTDERLCTGTYGGGVVFGVLYGPGPVACVEEALDEQPPSAPTGLTASTRYLWATVTWQRPADDDVSGYQVFRASAPTGPFTRAEYGATKEAWWQSYEKAGSLVYFAVRAVDRSGNWSRLSKPVGVKMRSAPPAPTGLRVTAVSATTITLAWDAVRDPDLEGYRVNAHNQRGDIRSAGIYWSTTQATFERLQPGDTWTFEVITEAKGANYSAPSGPVVATTTAG